MHRAGDARFQIAKRISAVLPDAVRSDQPLAVFLHAGGDRLLITGLDERFAVVARDLHVAGQDQQRRAGRGCRGDVHDHVGEAGTFGAGTGRDFTGRPRKSVGGGTHRAFTAAAVGRDARRGDGVDHRVVARTTKEGRQILFLAEFGEHLGPAHASSLEGPGLRLFVERFDNLFRNGDRGDAGRPVGRVGWADHAGHRTGAHGGRGKQERPPGRIDRWPVRFLGRFCGLGVAHGREAFSGQVKRLMDGLFN